MLSAIMEEIKKLRAKAGADVLTANNMAQNHMARKRTAQLRLPDLVRDYRTALSSHILPIIVTGSEASQFAATAKEKTGTAAVDGEAVYAEILSRLPKEVIGMAPKNVSELISRHFSDIAGESGILSYPAINHKSSKGFVVNNTSDLEKFVKKTINSSLGVEISPIFSLRAIAEQALEAEFSGNLFPVLVVVKDESLVDSLVSAYSKLSGASFLLTAGDVSANLNSEVLAKTSETDEEQVLKALTKVKNKMKKL